MIDVLLQERMAVNFGLALLHSLWLGAVIGALAWVALALQRKSSAKLRYVTAYGALAVLTAVPFFIFIGLQTQTVEKHPTASATFVQGLQSVDLEHPTVRPLVAQTREVVTGSAGATMRVAGHRIQRVRDSLHASAPWVCIAWFIGVQFLLIRFWAGQLYWHTLIRRHTTPALESTQDLACQLCQRMQLNRPVRVLMSARVVVPMVIGWVKPIILIPPTLITGMPMAQLEILLAHEIAHVRRFDPLLNQIQCVIEALLFYHPTTWFLSKQIRIEREHCCDDLVVRNGASPVQYAQSLLALMERATSTSTMVLSAVGGSPTARMQRLLATSRPQKGRNTGAFAGIILSAMIVAALWGGLQAARAQTHAQAPGARMVNFPEDRSMGQLLVRSWIPPSAPQRYRGWFGKESWQPFQGAQGSVEVPAGQELRLEVGRTAVADLTPLAVLAADDLQAISFRQTEVRDAQLINIEGLLLRELNFELTEISNEGLRYIESMTTLEYLSVGRTKVTSEGIVHLREMTNLQYLDLNLTGLNDEGMAYLENMTKLEWLDIWQGNITDEGMAYLDNLPRLRGLSLEANYRITDEGARHLKGLTQLEKLSLDLTGVGDGAAEYLRNHKELNELAIFGTRISDDGAVILAELPKLDDLMISWQIGPRGVEALSSKSGMKFHWDGDKLGPQKAIRLVDAKTQQDIPNAFIEMIGPEDSPVGDNPLNFWTDSSGTAIFYQRFGELTYEVAAFAEGYAPARGSWDTAADGEFTLALARPVRIGGDVVDEDGELVAGVSVTVPVAEKHDYFRSKMAEHIEPTDAEGHWICEHASTDASKFEIVLHHPAYAEAFYGPDALSMAMLQNESQVLMIASGLSLAGKVVDSSGRPLMEASVVLLEDRRELDGQDVLIATNAAAETDETGEFLLGGLDDGYRKFKVRAPGHVVKIVEVEMLPDMEPMRIELDSSKGLRGRVVDTNDNPIAGVTIFTMNSTKTTSVGGRQVVSSLIGPNDWKSVTNKEGYFAWTEAPDEPAQLRFTKREYVTTIDTLQPGNTEHKIVLRNPLMVSGQVLKAETGSGR